MIENVIALAILMVLVAVVATVVYYLENIMFFMSILGYVCFVMFFVLLVVYFLLAIYKAYVMASSWYIDLCMKQIHAHDKNSVVFSRDRVVYMPIQQTMPMPRLPVQNQLSDSKEVLLDIVEFMVESQRILLIGGSGTGKTELLKHYVATLLSLGKNVVIIDPHSPSRITGVNCVGAGLDFKEIESYMVNQMYEISLKYKNFNISSDGETDDDLYLIVDELRDIIKNVPCAVEWLECMLVRARKTGVKFCVVSQNDSVSSIGLKGDTGLLKACTRIELIKELNGKRHAEIGWKNPKRTMRLPAPRTYDFSEFKTISVERRNETEIKMMMALANLDVDNISKNEIFRMTGVAKNGKTMSYLNNLLESKNGH